MYHISDNYFNLVKQLTNIVCLHYKGDATKPSVLFSVIGNNKIYGSIIRYQNGKKLIIVNATRETFEKCLSVLSEEFAKILKNDLFDFNQYIGQFNIESKDNIKTNLKNKIQVKNGWYEIDGDLRHYVNGVFHNEKVPAIIYNNGSKIWCQNHKDHRLNGPAAEYSNGVKVWYYQGKLIDCNSQKEFEKWLKKNYSKDFNKLNNKINSKKIQLKNGWYEDNGFLIHYVNNKYHNKKCPAVIYNSKCWRQNNKYHRLDGPAVEYDDGSKEWYYKGKLTYCNSQKAFEKWLKKNYPKKFNKLNDKINSKKVQATNGWYQDEIGRLYHYVNDKWHNEKSPTIIWSDGSKFWFQNDKRHRPDGPAIEWNDGYKDWYYQGKFINCNSQKDFVKWLKKNSSKNFNKINNKINSKKVQAKNGWYQDEDYPEIHHYVNGKIHNEKSPACIWEDGSRFWVQNGKDHRIDGPAYEWSNLNWRTGSKFWWYQGEKIIDCNSQKDFEKWLQINHPNKLKNKTVRIKKNGNLFYYKNNLLHRNNGPAVIYGNGRKMWYRNGLKHRLNGPAVQDYKGDKWYYEGKLVDCNSQKQFEKWLKINHPEKI